jgi:hypothetical protein
MTPDEYKRAIDAAFCAQVVRLYEHLCGNISGGMDEKKAVEAFHKGLKIATEAHHAVSQVESA